MLITRKSMISEQVSTMDLDITCQQIYRYYSGALVQDAFPNLDPSEREFFISGITPAEWEETMSEAEK